MACTESPSVWRVWIEMLEDISNEFEEMSPSVWRVWIEILKNLYQEQADNVTLRVEGVD